MDDVRTAQCKPGESVAVDEQVHRDGVRQVLDETLEAAFVVLDVDECQLRQRSSAVDEIAQL